METQDTQEMNEQLKALEGILGSAFHDRTHLLTAMTHRSYLNENREAKQEHNERYEFLGDAVLELIVTDFLFNKFPEKPEGELTAVRAALVNTNTLSDAARELGVNEYLLLSRGEARDSGRARQYILANTFEAIVGAIYLDRGYDAAKQFVAEQLFKKTEEIVEKRLWQDSKSRFQELAQEHANVTPSYRVLSQEGPDHDRVFTIGVFLGDEQIAEGSGNAKQEAEQQAAERAIETKGW